jgi:hypothetical protein
MSQAPPKAGKSPRTKVDPQAPPRHISTGQHPRHGTPTPNATTLTITPSAEGGHRSGGEGASLGLGHARGAAGWGPRTSPRPWASPPVEPGPLAMTDGTGPAAAIWWSRDQLPGAYGGAQPKTGRPTCP